MKLFVGPFGVTKAIITCNYFSYEIVFSYGSSNSVNFAKLYFTSFLIRQMLQMVNSFKVPLGCDVQIFAKICSTKLNCTHTP